MNAHLERDISWRGKLYQAGDRQIPDGLAIALGLESSADEPTEPLPPLPTTAPKPAKRQKSP
ncbi:MAG TPA: hypothetical protein V6D10_07145 [Trichocoleus sp.]